MDTATTKPWISALLVLGIGALMVFTLVAFLVPASATDPSHLKGEALVGAQVPDSIQINTTGPSDVEMARITIPPGADGGWHEHNGSLIVTVSSGIATFYDRDDPTCTPHRYEAGDGLVEAPHHPHITRNEGVEPLVLLVVAITPSGRHSDKDVPASTSCRF